MAELLLEIGTEEIPSGYLDHALEHLEYLATRKLNNSRIKISTRLKAFGTPRRLTLIGEDISARQEDEEEEIVGPPKSVAFSPQGEPTKAALGFAKRQGVEVEALGIKETAKGQYVCVTRRIEGRPTIEVLTELLPQLVSEIPWPKSMRWGAVGFSFVRPIHWILALLDGDVIPFELAGLRSGNKTRGHRFMAPGEIEVQGIKDYLEKIDRAWVMLDPGERRKKILEVAKEAASEVGGEIAEDPELVGIVANLVEYPSAVCGSFDKRFLQLPEQVLITAMREHQRYFAVREAGGALMANFVTINNTMAKDVAVVRRGNERVLRARLADADFFFKEDRKRPLIDRLEELKGVIYQADLGTSFQKVMRFERLADFLVQRIAPEKRDEVSLACRLSKCDLVTHMVDEFPSLQGKMGEIYARLDGHPKEVCEAIREHYMPLRAGEELPGSVIGAIVGIADRMDTIVGCFAVGLEPTGAADPFALRRHALAILRILEKFSIPVPLNEFADKSAEILQNDVSFDKELVISKVNEFFRERYRQLMLRRGYGADEIEAVISVGFERVDLLRQRLDAIRRFFQTGEQFEGLALTFKRVKNILKKATRRYEVDPSLCRENCEKRLWDLYEVSQGQMKAAIDEGKYDNAFELLMNFREPVDRLFDEVEILTKEDDRLRENRLGLLQVVEELFLKIADFSRFSA